MAPKKSSGFEPSGTMDGTGTMNATMQHTQFQILVAARLRPFNKKELKECVEANCEPQPVLDVERDGKHCTLLDPTKGFSERANFSFDYIFSAFRPAVELQPSANSDDEDDDEAAAERAQAEIYRALGEPIVDSAWQGYNGCIFAYGQTSSGKTYTMMGTKRDPGIIPRLCRSLFERVEEVELTQQEELLMETPPTPVDDGEGGGAGPSSAVAAAATPAKSRKGRKIIKCEVSYMEIYNEKVKDLLKPKKNEKKKFNSRFDTAANNDDYENLKVRQHPLHGPFVEGITKLEVSNWLECVKLIRTGNEERSSATTDMNESSSRSHAIFQMVLTQTEALGAKVRGKEVTNHKVSKINLVDLAGSERITRTNVTGVHITEANYINKSLATLRKVIDVLVAKMSAGAHAAPVVIPYRESLLTWILSDNFGGNSKTVMMANVSPHQSNFLETESTLRYATLAKGIINRIRVNEDPSAKLIRELQAQLKSLQQEMTTAPQQQRVKELEEQMEENKKAMEELIVREEGMRQLIQESRSREEKLRHEKEDLERAQDHWKNEAEKLRKEKELLRDQLRRVAEGGKIDKDLLLSNNKDNFWMEDGSPAGGGGALDGSGGGSAAVGTSGGGGGGAAAVGQSVGGNDPFSPAETTCPPAANSRIRRASLASAKRRESAKPPVRAAGGGAAASGTTPSDAPFLSTSAQVVDEPLPAAGTQPDDAAVFTRTGLPPAGASGGVASSYDASISPTPHDAPKFGRRAATEEGKERDKAGLPGSGASGDQQQTVRTAEARAGRRRPPDSLDVLACASSSPIPPQPSTVPLSLQHLAGPSASTAASTTNGGGGGGGSAAGGAAGGGAREASPKIPQMPDALDSFLTGGGDASKRGSAVPPWRQRKH